MSSREKKLLVSSEDYGRDLTGVQNLRKKHKRLEAELAAHEPAIQVSRALGPSGQRGLGGPGPRTAKPFALVHFPEVSVVLTTPHPKPGRSSSERSAEAFSWKHLEAGTGC